MKDNSEIIYEKLLVEAGPGQECNVFPEKTR